MELHKLSWKLHSSSHHPPATRTERAAPMLCFSGGLLSASVDDATSLSAPGEDYMREA